ncbi:hypothetical protein [Stenotrophomonas sp.]|uniref:hypothetical protein n=1 Tax=Stenotrophomonas sp. TaxID=69392 RepID=UPI00289CBCE8|nr:hypothetical protein [Stenotrophomonas sp.]
MKKWMKCVVAKEPITSCDLLAVALVGILLGGTITWFFFAAFWNYQVFASAGNAADWIAGVGTWAVGVGAAWYAREAHLQRVAESAQQSRERLEADSRILNRIRVKMTLAVWMGCVLGKQPATDAEGPLFIPNIRNSVRAICWGIQTISFSLDETSTLNLELQSKVIDLSLSISKLGVLMDFFKERGEDNSPSLRRDINALQGSLKEIFDCADKLQRELTIDIQRLQVLIDAHTPPPIR